jgi:hypothetical protein
MSAITQVPDTMRSVMRAIIGSDAKRATKFLAADLVVRATRIHKVDRRSRRESLMVTYGKPNHAERKFIKAAAEAGETFPMHRVQLKAFPVKRG